MLLNKLKYYTKDPVFSIEFTIDEPVRDLSYFKSMLLILNKYFGGYYFVNPQMSGLLKERLYWEDVLLTSSEALISNYHESGFDLVRKIYIPLRSIIDNIDGYFFLKDGMSIYINIDNDRPETCSVIIELNSILFLDNSMLDFEVNYSLDKQIEISIANREKFQSLIKELKDTYNWSVSDFWSEIGVDERFISADGLIIGI